MTINRTAVWFCIVSILGMAMPSKAHERKLVSGHVPAVVHRSRSTGDLPSDSRLNLTIGLPLRNTAQLQQRMADVYDPNSRNYHHFLTPGEFTEQFGPTAEQYRAVEAYAHSNHLTVMRTHPNRMLIDVRAAAADVEKTFGVHMRKYHRPEGGGDFFAPDVEPSVNADVPILDVGGLSNYRLPHPMIRGGAVARHMANANPNAGSGSGGAYIGNDFRAAYVPGVSLNGAGQTIGLLEFDGYYAADITSYETKAGLPSVPLQKVLLDGYNGVPTSNGNAEVSLDIEMAISMAPGLSKVVVYEAGPTGSANDMLNRMANDNTAKELACSWTWSGGPSATTDQIFQQMALQGQSFFCASGDGDAYMTGAVDNPSNTDSPADSPYITSVGATTLTTSGPGGARVTETVWNWGGGEGSSGGVSSYYAIPPWQQGMNMAASHGSTTMRNIPDVAMAGDNIYVAYGNGSSGTFGGTSCAAPLWAGFIALVNQQGAGYGLSPIGFLNPAIYAVGKGSNYNSLMNDVTTGNNTSVLSPTAFYATAGYDLCSGWGSPKGAGLINALAAPPDALGISPTNGFSSAGKVGGPFNASTMDFVLTNQGAALIKWSAGNIPSWLTVSTTSGTLLPGGPAGTVTVSLNSGACALPDGSYSATIWFTNTTSGYATSRQFNLTPTAQLVQNGGFEAGSFYAWELTGNTEYTYVASSSFFLHSGNYGTELGPFGAPGLLSQTLSTVPGQSYILSFWLNNPQPGGTPNEFSASWNGTTVFDRADMPVTAWTNIQVIVKATVSSTVLQFSFRNDPGYFGLDDVSVLPFAVPALQSLTKINASVQLSLNTTVGMVYQLQYVTDLQQTNWVNLGPPFTASSTVTTFTDNTAIDPQRFYRFMIHP